MDKESIIKLFASNVRAERARKKYSLEELSEKAGITPEYLNRIEHEKYNPTISVAVNIAIALDVPIGTLITFK
jgi:transcriptional regulator with XRE-family HTH domain